MNKIFCAILSVFLVGAANAVPAVVDYIFDGDTFAAAVSLEPDISISVRVRLINIDTPELNGQCASEISKASRAKERLEELLPIGETVNLENIKDDKYLGRIDANVYLLDGRDVGEILVKEKFARRYNGGKRIGWCD